MKEEDKMNGRNPILDVIIVIAFVLWVAIPLIQICWGSKKLGGMTDYGD